MYIYLYFTLYFKVFSTSSTCPSFILETGSFDIKKKNYRLLSARCCETNARRTFFNSGKRCVRVTIVGSTMFFRAFSRVPLYRVRLVDFIGDGSCDALDDPGHEFGNPCADARQVGLGAADAPGDDARQEVAAVLAPHLQRTARVALRMIFYDYCWKF